MPGLTPQKVWNIQTSNTFNKICLLPKEKREAQIQNKKVESTNAKT